MKTTMNFVPALDLLSIALISPASAAESSPVPMQAEHVAADEGALRIRSHYGVDETIARLKADIAAKCIKFIDQIDQQKLGANAGVKLNPSTLLIFGNPPLGTQFLTANPYSGKNKPEQMLVLQDTNGQV